MNPTAVGNLLIRPLREDDLPTASEVCGTAFATFLGMNRSGDADRVRTRWLMDPKAAIAAELDGQVVGSNFAANWGSIGFFGPLSVRPDLWGRGIAQKLLEPTMELFRSWGSRHLGLLTFSQSPMHVGLYQKFGFWPRYLTAVMSKEPDPSRQAAGSSRYTQLTPAGQKQALQACRDLADSIYEGLDLTSEILAVATQKTGDAVLLWDGSQLEGFAICHAGAGSEAGTGLCLIKFGAARSGPKAGASFDRLLDACEALAISSGVSRLAGGANAARPEAYEAMRRHGFRPDFLGVIMDRPNEPGYNREGVYLIDDWR